MVRYAKKLLDIEIYLLFSLQFEAKNIGRKNTKPEENKP